MVTRGDDEPGTRTSFCLLSLDYIEAAGPHPIRRRLDGYIADQSYTSEDSPL